MNSRELYREIGRIDVDFIEEAGEKKKKKRHGYFAAGGAVAACILLGVAGIVWQQGDFRRNKPQTDDRAEATQMKSEYETGSTQEQYPLEFREISGMMEADLCIPGHFWEKVTDEELEHICAGLKAVSDYITPMLEAHYDGEGTLQFVEGQMETTSGGTLYLQIAPGKVVMDCIIETDEEKISEIRGVEVNAGCYENAGTQTTVYIAEFRMDDVDYYIELTGGEQEYTMLPVLIDAIICGGKADFDVLNPAIPKWREESPTQEEAYKDEEFGQYLPKEIPEGFSFEWASRIYYEGTETREETNYLCASWQNGMDSVYFHISYLTEQDRERITSAADMTNYDLNLYPIPRAESVPDELYEIVENPIFPIEELSEEVVNKRAYRAEDAGDTDGYRMGFSVLYPGDVIVEINAKGINPLRMYQMLKEIPESD